jgi:iron complex transport system substrate-binding protein
MSLKLLAAAALLTAFTAAAQTPRRIVSTAPSATEILYALGLGDRVAGVTTYCRYPPEVQSKPKIGTYLQPNFEAILAARPDLVIVVKNPVRLAERMQAMGLKVLELGEETLPGIYQSIHRVAEAAGVPRQGRELSERMAAELRSIEAVTRSLRRTKMMFIVSRSPGRIEGLMAVGQASYLNDLIGIAGGKNVFATAASSYPKVSLEEVLSRNPEVIVDMGDMADTKNVSDEHKRRVVQIWQQHPTLAAVRRQAVNAVASDIFVVPGPRAVEAARSFLRMLHPEVAR